MTEEFSNDLMYTILLRRQHTKNNGDGLQWETKKIRPGIRNVCPKAPYYIGFD